MSAPVDSLAAQAAGLHATSGGGFWLPPAASTTAGEVDWLFKFIFVISCVFFLLIVALIVLFVVRYRRRPGREAEPSVTHNHWLEVTWTGIPVILVLIIFYFGFRGYMDVATPPGNAYEIQVVAQRWNWSFVYPNGYVDGTLHVPVGVPIRLILTSEDVIHGFYVPDFRIKKDVVPGRYNKVWFQADKPGEHQIYCTQYCGLKHSEMLSTVVVHEQGGFEKWLAGASDFLTKLPPDQAGARLYKSRGCASCHSVNGSPGVGPTFLGVFGHEVELNGGGEVIADENYVRESILDPGAKVVRGFQPVMPTFKGRISDAEIAAIIAYLKTLK